MRGAVAAFLTFLALTPPTLPRAAEPLAELEAAQTALYERIAPGVAVVTCSGSVGAAFAVAPGLLLTAGHVVGDAREVEVGLRDGRTVRGVVVERGADGLDVALIRIPAEPPILVLAPSAQLRPGSFVATLGHPDGNRFVLATGLVAQASDDAASAALVRLQLPLRAGASGGPVVDRSGRVVGVVALGAAGTVTFAVRAEAAVRALPALSDVLASDPAPAMAQGGTPADVLPLAGSAPSPGAGSEGELRPAIVSLRPDSIAEPEDERPALTAPVLVTAVPDRVRSSPRARTNTPPLPHVLAPVLVVAPPPEPRRSSGARPQAHGRALHAATLRPPAPDLPPAPLPETPATIPILAGAALALAGLGVGLAITLRVATRPGA